MHFILLLYGPIGQTFDLICTHTGSNDAARPNEVLFGGLIDETFYSGDYPLPKFSMNVEHW